MKRYTPFLSMIAAFVLSIPTCFSASNPDTTKLNESEISVVMSAHLSEIAATIACRSYVDGGSARVNLSISKTQRALERATGDNEAAKAYIAQIHNAIEKVDPETSLKQQFDSVGADLNMRSAKCEQLISGRALKADEADIQYGVK